MAVAAAWAQLRAACADDCRRTPDGPRDHDGGPYGTAARARADRDDDAGCAGGRGAYEGAQGRDQGRGQGGAPAGHGDDCPDDLGSVSGCCGDETGAGYTPPTLPRRRDGVRFAVIRWLAMQHERFHMPHLRTALAVLVLSCSLAALIFVKPFRVAEAPD